ncbi:MAG: hypothetical protein H6Q90_1261 [Deltaproteobacteria bacterium]|nr:hypothetical protein [Deltaproteobacteria bacterium]
MVVMRLYPALVVILAGCNVVFPLDGPARSDAGDDPAMGDALPANCRVTSPLEPFAATYLVDTTPRQDAGFRTEVITDAGQPALFTFGVDVDPLTEHVAAAILLVTPITKCGQGCGACPTGATSYQVFWNFEDWDEVEATSTNLDAATPWGADFAAGTADRSALIIDDVLPTGPQLALRIPMTNVARVPAAPWIGKHSSVPQTRLSLQLRTDHPAAFASDDHDESPCMEAAGVPSLVLTICP